MYIYMIAIVITAFWILHNRGMGIVSLRSKPCEGYWIRYYKGRMVNQVVSPNTGVSVLVMYRYVPVLF